MKFVKILISLIILVWAWIVTPVEAFVLNGNYVSAGTDYSSAGSFQQEANLNLEPEVFTAPNESFNPYLQSRPRSFSSTPGFFKSSSRLFARGARSYGSAGGRETYSTTDTTPTQTPEPATLLLFGMGLAGAGIYRRMKK